MAISTGNQQLVKQINKALVLETLKKETPISRVDISQRIGLNKGTVSSLINELMNEHLVYESGPGQSSGGRRPVMLNFNGQAGYSIGIDLGVNYILGLLTDLNGNIIVEKNVKLNTRSYDDVFLKLKTIIQELINSAKDSFYGIVGIGIGVPGLVNNDGKILLAPNLEWGNIQLREEIVKLFNIPVLVENEANAGAYGEKLFGAGKAFNDIIYVSAGIGIGVGIIIKGKLFTGMNGYSGEMGHMIIQVGGKDCPCGSSGCWELYASEQALLDEAKKLKFLSLSEEMLSIEYLIELANNGNEEVINLFYNIGLNLAVGIKNIIYTFNPEQIIIGNRLVMAKNWLEKPITNFINNHTMEHLQKDIRINYSDLTTHSTAIGISAIVIERFLKDVVHT